MAFCIFKIKQVFNFFPLWMLPPMTNVIYLAVKCSPFKHSTRFQSILLSFEMFTTAILFLQLLRLFLYLSLDTLLQPFSFCCHSLAKVETLQSVSLCSYLPDTPGMCCWTNTAWNMSELESFRSVSFAVCSMHVLKSFTTSLMFVINLEVRQQYIY